MSVRFDRCPGTPLRRQVRLHAVLAQHGNDRIADAITRFEEAGIIATDPRRASVIEPPPGLWRRTMKRLRQPAA